MRPNDYLDRQTSIIKTHRYRPLLKHSNPALEAEGLTSVERQYAQAFWSDLPACFGIGT